MSDDMSRVGGGRHDAAHTTAPAIAATEVKNTTLLDAFYAIFVSQIPMKMSPPKKSPEPKTQIPRYKFKLDQSFHLNVYREILGTLIRLYM